MQWRFGSQFKINNRIDVLDEKNKWLEGRVININIDKIQIHYKGYVNKYDEWIYMGSSRLAEIGTFSKAFGRGRKLAKSDRKEFF